MQLLLLTPENDHPDEIKLVEHFLEQGLQRLHLRKPAYTRTDYSDYLSGIDAGYHKRIVLHGHFELMEKFDIGGIHLNTAMRNDVMLMRQWSCYDKRSASFHSWNEIEVNTIPYQYVFISPVFDSISKKGYEACIDMAGAQALRKKKREARSHCPLLMGLGGVSAQNIDQLISSGFDGAVVLGSVWQAHDPALNFKQLMEAAGAGCRR